MKNIQKRNGICYCLGGGGGGGGIQNLGGSFPGPPLKALKKSLDIEPLLISNEKVHVAQMIHAIMIQNSHFVACMSARVHCNGLLLARVTIVREGLHNLFVNLILRYT